VERVKEWRISRFSRQDVMMKRQFNLPWSRSPMANDGRIV